LVDDHEEPHPAGLGGRGDGLERGRLVGIRSGLARFPDARDRERVEAGAGQLVDERGRVAGAGGVVDDPDGELVAGVAAARGEQDDCEESAGTNAAVLTGSPPLKRVG
jgi:hypothetical protein